MRRNLFFVFAISMTPFVFTGCAGDEAGLQNTVPSPSIPTTPSNESAADSSCTQSGFTAEARTRALSDNEKWSFTVISTDRTATLTISSRLDENGPMTTGRYSLDGSTFADCGLCLLLVTECISAEDNEETFGIGPCSRFWHASEGTVDITKIGTAEGETLAGHLEGVVFEELWAEERGLTSVSDDETRCFDDYEFSGTIVADPRAPRMVVPYENTSDTCVVDGNGTNIGHNIAGFELQNCAGETVNLQEQYCGQGKSALWLTTSAEWCGPCLAYDPVYYALASQNDNIDFYVLLGDDATGTTTINCPDGFGVEYISGIGPVPPSHVLIDPNWTTTDRIMNAYNNPGIPYSRVLNGNNMEYIWTENAFTDVVLDVEQALRTASGKSTLSGWSQFEQNMDSITNQLDN